MNGHKRTYGRLEHVTIAVCRDAGHQLASLGPSLLDIIDSHPVIGFLDRKRFRLWLLSSGAQDLVRPLGGAMYQTACGIDMPGAQVTAWKGNRSRSEQTPERGSSVHNSMRILGSSWGDRCCTEEANAQFQCAFDQDELVFLCCVVMCPAPELKNEGKPRLSGVSQSDKDAPAR